VGRMGLTMAGSKLKALLRRMTTSLTPILYLIIHYALNLIDNFRLSPWPITKVDSVSA
jgi:hypothetical protein